MQSPTPPSARSPEPSTQQGGEITARKNKSWRPKSVWENGSSSVQGSSERYLLVRIHLVTNGILLSVCCYKTKAGCKLEKSARIHTTTMKKDDSGAVALLKDTRQLGCVLEDMEPPKSSSISRKGAKILKPIRRVRFTKATLRHANIRENKGPSLGEICTGDPHQCPQSCVEVAPKNILKLKEKDKSTLFSPMEDWCLLAPSEMRLEEREFFRCRLRSVDAHAEQ